MGAWPDWWPANPIGSAYDEYKKQQAGWDFVIWAVIILVAALIVLYVYTKVKK